MSMMIIAVVALVLLAGLTAVAKTFAGPGLDAGSNDKSGSAPFLVDTRSYFFSVAENRFFTSLVPAAHALDLMVFPKVGLNDIFKDRKAADRGQYNRYAQMHIDYLLVTRKDYKPVAGVELDGASHHCEKQQARDQKKAAAFKAAKLPLLRFFNQEKVNEADLRLKLEDVLGKSPFPKGDM